ncbi:MAG: deoxyuridine 5-triphosphate nucleotidohydrolase [Gemmatimonadetes bacterium]|nr:deoxyuridine 5-triphosphate nucleotidohydrolase [Gemmatimonadota bacterium]
MTPDSPRSPLVVIERLHPDALVPKRATADSAGHDLAACLHGDVLRAVREGDALELPVIREAEGCWVMLPPHTRALVPLGFKARLPRGYEAQVRPRSGTSFRKGLTIPNSPGTIDADYPDEWMVIVGNPGDVPLRIDHGERIAQMVLQRYEVLPFEEGSVSRSTERSGGFGSTGS